VRLLKTTSEQKKATPRTRMHFERRTAIDLLES